MRRWSGSSQTQTLWHADETRWLVFASIEGKVGYRWYLWVFHSAEVVVFVLAAGRSHEVPEEHFGPVEGRGILVVDRYKAYQAIDKVKSGMIVVAFCWAHVRRDFVRLARSWPDQESWALGWVAEIGTLYHLNDKRLKVRDDAAAFAVADGALRAAVTSLGTRGEEQLREAGRPSGSAEGAGEPGGSLEWLDGVRRAPRGCDEQQYGGAFRAWPGGGSEELLRQRVGVERPTGGDAVFAVPDALPVGSEPPTVVDGVPVSMCGSRWPSPGGSWSDSCRGTSAPRRDASGAVTTRSRRRTRRSRKRESDSKPTEPAGLLANPSFGLWECASAERRRVGRIFTSPGPKPESSTPAPMFPETRLPENVVFSTDSRLTPPPESGSATDPERSVPIRFPVIV